MYAGRRFSRILLVLKITARDGFVMDFSNSNNIPKIIEYIILPIVSL